MPDMLVPLYKLPPPVSLDEQGITLRRGLAPEKHIVLDWISKHFSEYWRSEADVAFARQPVTCILATDDNGLLGFGCYDTTKRGFFGPTGVAEPARGRGIGTALLLACLHDMFAQDYGYAIIGGVGPVAFYQRTVNAVVIADSTPGVYRGMLRP
jgi:GNAT superfamily N-acetyltransferase